jgi:hypothetical protein
LPPDRPPETINLQLIEPEIRRLVLQSQTMHQRDAPDAQWRNGMRCSRRSDPASARTRLDQATFEANLPEKIFSNR